LKRFQIVSAILEDRGEGEPLKEIAFFTKKDLARFFENFTGRKWGKPDA
jgi:hypothetical protein